MVTMFVKHLVSTYCLPLIKQDDV